jgi:hypothetical protein
LEIICCNVELRCLHTAICDEERQFTHVLSNLKASGESTYYAVLDYCTRRRGINNQLLHQIAKTYALEGFMGIPLPGVRKGMNSAQLSYPTGDINEHLDDKEDPSDEEELAEEIDKLVDYLSVI